MPVLMMLRRFSPAISVIAALLLVLLGPDWPERKTDLRCGDDLEVRRSFQDMDACAREMDQGCACMARQSWIAPTWYVILVPGVLIASLLMRSRGVGRATGIAFGVAAFAAFLLPWPIMLMYFAGLPIPAFFQNVVFVWPQRVFFVLYIGGERGGPLLPWRWAYLFPVGCCL